MIFDIEFATTTLKLPPTQNQPLSGVSIDTRTIKEGAMFAAIRGPRFDGHDYIDKAVKAGCGAILVEVAPDPLPNCPVLVVPNVLTAMEQLATAWRYKVNPVVIAVTGSSGKTTVKELLSLCLKEHFNVVHATHGNLNNHFGVPLTLLSMPHNCQVLVVEMGMSALGEIAHLTSIAKPDMGIVTNVLAAHLAAFNNIEEIAQAKGELFAGLSQGATAILNNSSWAKESLQNAAKHCKTLTFCQQDAGQQKADLIGTDIKMADGKLAATFSWRDKISVNVNIAGQGRYMIDNALAAATALRQVGVTPQQIAQGLKEFSPPQGRGGREIALGGWEVIDDSYNANPGSVKAAIAALRTTPKEARRIVILGDMLELGKQAASLHKELFNEIVKAGVSHVFTAGPLMKHLYDRCKNEPTLRAQHRDDPADWLGIIPPPAASRRPDTC
ncbi:MAG: UDP-N-acetylmuramoyl-tripeptide--D-alanyl-D-alanine ligase [Magnetococcales bacterium]|nr:UDP-N-acetylmuramoyl-tripeptide--D-alanyl-D-alanine ligase [Magnetococcales bacterium]